MPAPPRGPDGRISRVSGRKLQEIREAWFRKYPLCVACDAKGRVNIAVELDHVVPLFKGGLDFDVDHGKNRQGLCQACHDAKTRVDLGQKPKRTIGLDGFPIDEEGTPP